MGKDKDKTGKFVINYQYSRSLAFHKLLTKKRITKYYLCSILQVSQISTVTRLINQPYLLSIQQVINLSFALDVSFVELCNVITTDLKTCLNSFDPNLLSFVPPHLRELTKSNEWFER
jgi:hypothetical protein